ncbi:prolyl oligopeptidase family serine peptidase [Paracoccus sp. (in: a-proteobacteria)]|uniref:S9 family peptidase n=1 Tax=Paracoccus sp. TaxID=267 RepID=UPI00322088F2
MIDADAIAPYLEIPGHRAPAREAGTGRLAFLSDASGTAQIWLSDDSGTRRITDHAEPVNALAWNPKGGSLLFMADCGGDERWQPHLLNPDTGELRKIIDDPMTVHMWGAFSPDGAQIALTANADDKSQLDIWLVDLASGARRRIGGHMGHQEVLAFTADGRSLLVRRTLGAGSDQKLDLVEIATGARRPVLEAPHRVRFAQVRALKAGGGLAICDFGGDRLALWRFGEDGIGEARIHAEDGCDLEAVALLPDQTGAVVAVNDRGYSRLRLVDLAGGAARDLALPFPAIVGNMTVPGDGSRLLCALTSAVEAPSVWEIALADGAALPLHRAEPAAAPGFIAPAERVFASFDGLEVPFFVYTPAGAKPAGGWPAVFIIHGGPEAQWRPDFRADVQWMLAQGLMVVAPNVRGSTGYGRRYHGLDDREKRLDSVSDLEALRAHLVAAGLVDAARCGVFGRSYGGYMVMAALTEHPARWKFGVNFYGIGNFFTHLLATGPWARQIRVAEYGDPETQPDLLRRISPVFRIGEVRAPLLLVHADRDPRVPPGESETIHSLLFGLGRRCEILRVAHEGHGFNRRENVRRVFGRLAAFIAREI